MIFLGGVDLLVLAGFGFSTSTLCVGLDVFAAALCAD
jgi:hypothetical protein